MIWFIAETITERNAKGKNEIVYGDLFLSIIETGTHVSSLEISSVATRIHEQILRMYIFVNSNSRARSAVAVPWRSQTIQNSWIQQIGALKETYKPAIGGADSLTSKAWHALAISFMASFIYELRMLDSSKSRNVLWTYIHINSYLPIC